MNYEYMRESEELISYYQFPKFLLEMALTQNARMLYMLLYDRARISQKNHWVDKDGYIYFIFPITEISAKIGKCKSSVKAALKELDEAGLLVRRSGGFSQPNHLYVKVPCVESLSEPDDFQTDEKQTVIRLEKNPSFGRNSNSAMVGNTAPSKGKEKCNISKNNGVNYAYEEGESL